MTDPSPEPTTESSTQIIAEPEDTNTRDTRIVVTTDDAIRIRRRSGCFWGLAGGVGCFVVLFLVIAVPVLLAPTMVSSFVGGLIEPLRLRPAAAHVLSTQTVVQRIQPLGHLVSLTADLVKADVLVSVEDGLLNACGFSANHVVQGALEAGVDLNGLKADDLQYDELTDTYTLTLPAAELTSCRIDYIRQYDTTTSACSIDWDAARLMASYTALTEFRDDELEAGFLDRAEREARSVLGNFLEVLTGSHVVINFRPSTRTTMPVSCEPQTPPEWVYDTDKHVWTKSGQ